MQEILREPVELIDEDLDEVAGGNPFSLSSNSGHFAIGAVFGNSSSASGLFAGQFINKGVILFFYFEPSITINL